MAILTGNDGSLVVGTTTVAALRNFSIEQTSDTIETTTMGKDVRTYLKGLSSWSGSADVIVSLGTDGNLTGGSAEIAKLIATGGAVGDSSGNAD